MVAEVLGMAFQIILLRLQLVAVGLLFFSVLKVEGEDRAGPEWWSLQPLKEVKPPSNGQRHVIDSFVVSHLKERGLELSPMASPRSQIRRLYFDLVGMPPTVEEVRAFEADPSNRAYLGVVNDLLASPAYGERWARHWLDLARFGESDGFERNNPRNNLWPYRDWVIKAFNDDMPYDEFARMQIAGDHLRPGFEGMSAVAFLTAGLHNTVIGSSEFMRKTARQDELEDITGTVGQTFLGLTVNCARCHDHKYDPVSQREYYQLASTLRGVYRREQEVEDSTAVARKAAAGKRLEEISKRVGEIERMGREQALARRNQSKTKKNAPLLLQPLARWEFEKGLKDSLGGLHGTAMGSARVENGELVLDGSSGFVKTLPLTGDVTEKTLESWVRLDSLDQKGGGVIGLQTADGSTFDSIVFGERTDRAWMAGSNRFERSEVHGGAPEEEAHKNAVHLAIVYKADGTIIRYRNGVLYDRSYKSKIQHYAKGKAHLVFGLRHGTSPGAGTLLRGKILRAQFYDRALTPDAVAASAGVESNFVPEAELLASLELTKRQEWEGLRAEAARIREEMKSIRGNKRKVYTVRADTHPGPARLLERGHALKRKEEVPPGGVAAVRGPSAQFGMAANAPDAARRRKLAEWITAEDNPLFTRVMANRLWHLHFGRGLVKTPNDLGFNGGKPSHPLLLDWLARELRENGYRLKHMHRLMVTSNAYRQSSRPSKRGGKVDSDNRLLWRKSPIRLDAESLRDSMLAVSGLLNEERGGPGFRDVTLHSNNGTTYYFPFDKEGDPNLNRRTVYRFSPRGRRSTILEAFDCPDPSTTAPQRSVTTTPLQALALLNNDFALRMAKGLARRVKEEVGDDLQRQVGRSFELAYGREAGEKELRLGEQFATEHGMAALGRVLLNSNEFVVLD